MRFFVGKKEVYHRLQMVPRGEYENRFACINRPSSHDFESEDVGPDNDDGLGDECGHVLR